MPESVQVNREELLNKVTLLMSGVANREIIEHSSSIVIEKGIMRSYNDEVSVVVKFAPFKQFEDVCVIPSKELHRILNRLKSDFIEVTISKDRFEITTKRTSAIINGQSDTSTLPNASLEEKGNWNDLQDSFFKALDLCKHTTSNDTITPFLFCVHVTPDYMESTDGLQATRMYCKIPIEHDILIPLSCVREIVKLDWADGGQFAVGSHWLHFRNKDKSATISCRLFLSGYVNLEKVIHKGGEEKSFSIAIPETFDECIDNVMAFQEESFESDIIKIILGGDKATIIKETTKGMITENCRLRYKGEEVVILVHPVLFQNLLKRGRNLTIDNKTIKHEGDACVFVTRRVRSVST